MNSVPLKREAGPAGSEGTSNAELERVLVVDDSSTARMMAVGLLRDAGLEVEGVGDGASALAILDAYKPDLIVLDILMPVMDGLEVCRRIRALEGGQGIPILFLTGDERVQTQEQAIEVGGDDLVYKPALQRELLIRTRSLLRVRRLQAALERESRFLKELQIRQEGLFRFIVHDLKSPLQAILASAEMIADMPEIGDETSKMADTIKRGTLMMERMVQDILVVCHQGDLTPMRQPIALHDAMETWTEGVRPSFARRKVSLLNEIPPELVVEADQELLRRCMLNLLENALKYGPTGNEVCIRAWEEGQQVQVRTVDRGPGIPVGMERVIFDPFARLERDAPLARVSSGLGLAFCKEVAQAHGGSIWVEAGDPTGAVFCLALPMRP